MTLAHSRVTPAPGFTLVELMVALSIAGVVLTAMISGFGTFQQVFTATDHYYRATSDQMRVLDFIAQDMRRAIPMPSPSPSNIGSVTNSGQTLTLNLPDYLDETSTSPTPTPAPTPRTPDISALGAVTYGTKRPQVIYTIEGVAPNQTITRTYDPAPGATPSQVVKTTLTQTAADYQFRCFDPSNSGSTADFTFGGSGRSSSLTVKVTFMPKFNRLGMTSARAGTAASTTIVVRNHL